MDGIVAGREGVVKAKVLDRINALVEELFASDPEDEHTAECSVWVVLLEIGRLLLTALLARRCWRAAVEDISKLGLSVDDVRFRFEQDYRAVIKTTLGRIEVPWFAYRISKAGVAVTRTPSRSVLPLHPHCRSSTLLVRWATLLGAQTAFRNAELLLNVLTHGAVTIHDTTVSAYCQVVASVIDRGWLYRDPASIREILAEQAVRDQDTGKPVVYISCDAHAEKVYEGETWRTCQQMFNGIRVWCVDSATGRTIPLGGEFLVGDCHAVADAFADLIARGIVPSDGDYGGGLVAQIAFVADGMPWFDDYILPLFPGAVVILDAYHVLDKIAGALAKVFGIGSRLAKKAYNALCRWVTGRSPRTRKQPPTRAGTPKRKKPTAPYLKRRNFPIYDPDTADGIDIPEHAGAGLLAAIAELDLPDNEQADAAIADLMQYLLMRLDRIRYDEFWRRGLHISSAPMESFHRIAQHRLKLQGTTWTPEVAQAVLNLRMMSVIGNDGRFWDDPTVRRKVALAFEQRASS